MSDYYSQLPAAWRRLGSAVLEMSDRDGATAKQVRADWFRFKINVRRTVLAAIRDADHEGIAAARLRCRRTIE